MTDFNNDTERNIGENQVEDNRNFQENIKSDNAQSDGSYSFTGSQLPKDETDVTNRSESGRYGGSASASTGSSYGESYKSTSQSNGTYADNSQTTQTYYSGYSQSAQTGNTSQSYGGYSYGNTNPAGGYSNQYSQYGNNGAGTVYSQKPPKKAKAKKEKKPVSRGMLAAVLAVSILCSGALGFGGGFAATKMFGGGVTVNQSSSSSSGTVSTPASSTTAKTTAEIVEQTANSVVEITTETVSTGSFFQQYVSKGAGSGVIISEDGYILTNNHVIEGANNVSVKLKDSTEYKATVVGTDEQLDVALLKVDASGLSPATFGDSSSLKVGDYSVAIGNPLGELGGTVTDGIISALDRDVIVDGETMRLLQTNAAINPGNSGGGLFNANGELVGIVCAKASSSQTEVEGLGFAIPINKVLDILNDLKQYGYVQGRVDLGMTLTNVNSSTVYQQGVYVKSVNQNSNAQKAGFQTGDLITKVNGADVQSVSDVNKITESLKVGDNVTFTVTRGTKSGDINFTLEEYKPSNNSLANESNDLQQFPNGGNSIWDYFTR